MYLIRIRECILSCILPFLRTGTGISLVAGKAEWGTGSTGQDQAAFARMCIRCSLAAPCRGRELPAWLLAFCATSLVQMEQAMAEMFVPCETGHQTWMERQHWGWQAEPYLGDTEVKVHRSWHRMNGPWLSKGVRSVVTKWDESCVSYAANMAGLQLAGQAVGCQASLWLVAGSGKLQHKPCCGSQESWDEEEGSHRYIPVLSCEPSCWECPSNPPCSGEGPARALPPARVPDGSRHITAGAAAAGLTAPQQLPWAPLLRPRPHLSLPRPPGPPGRARPWRPAARQGGAGRCWGARRRRAVQVGTRRGTKGGRGRCERAEGAGRRCGHPRDGRLLPGLRRRMAGPAPARPGSARMSGWAAAGPDRPRRGPAAPAGGATAAAPPPPSRQGAAPGRLPDRARAPRTLCGRAAPRPARPWGRAALLVARHGLSVLPRPVVSPVPPRRDRTAFTKGWTGPRTTRGGRPAPCRTVQPREAAAAAWRGRCLGCGGRGPSGREAVAWPSAEPAAKLFFRRSAGPLDRGHEGREVAAGHPRCVCGGSGGGENSDLPVAPGRLPGVPAGRHAAEGRACPGEAVAVCGERGRSRSAASGPPPVRGSPYPPPPASVKERLGGFIGVTTARDVSPCLK